MKAIVTIIILLAIAFACWAWFRKDNNDNNPGGHVGSSGVKPGNGEPKPDDKEHDDYFEK